MPPPSDHGVDTLRRDQVGLGGWPCWPVARALVLFDGVESRARRSAPVLVHAHRLFGTNGNEVLLGLQQCAQSSATVARPWFNRHCQVQQVLRSSPVSLDDGSGVWHGQLSRGGIVDENGRQGLVSIVGLVVVGQVVVVGDQKPFISALVTLDPEMLPTWLANNGLPGDMSLEDAATNDAVRAEVQKAIDRANAFVSRAESIRKFVILPTEWTEASGHLTPKMSIKRNVIMADFSDQIEELYSVPVSTSNLSLS